MRTFFDIVLGILVNVLKASLHALVSTAGVFAIVAVLAGGGAYTVRRTLRARSSRARSADVIPIDR